MKSTFKYSAVAFAAGVAIAISYPAKAFDGSALVVMAVNAAQAALSKVMSNMGSTLANKIMDSAKDMVSAQMKASSDLGSILQVGNQVGQTVMSEAAARTQEMIARVGHTKNLLDIESRFMETSPCSVAPSATALRDSMGTAANLVGNAPQIAGMSGGASSGGSGFKFSPKQSNPAMAAVLNTSEGRGGGARNAPSRPAPEVTQALAAEGACGTFVIPGSPRGVACQNAKLTPANPNGFANADINAATLVNGPRAPRAPATLSFNFDQDSVEHKAISAYRRNLFSTFEQRDLSPAEAATDPGRRYLAMRDAYNGRMSLAEMPVNLHIAGMTSNPATITALRALMDPQAATEGPSDLEFTRNYLARAKPDWQTRGVSSDELLNLEVQRRYLNPDWLNRTVVMAAEPRAAEALRVSALTNVLLLELRNEVRLNNLLQGATMANAIRQESMPELTRAQAQASR